MGAHLGASRLLYGMGRDDAIPRRFFGAVNPRTHVPSNNVILVGAIALAGAFTVSYGLGAELLNFGAFIAFMGVNLSALLHYWWRAEKKTAPQPAAAAPRLPDLRLPLVEPQLARPDRRLRLARDGRRLRRLEDAGLPEADRVPRGERRRDGG